MPVVDKVAAAHRDRDRVPRHRRFQRSLGFLRHVSEARDARAAPFERRPLGLLPARAGGLSLVDPGVRVVVLGVEAAVVLYDVVDAACYFFFLKAGKVFFFFFFFLREREKNEFFSVFFFSLF